MDLLNHTPQLLADLVARFVEHKLIFGHGSRYRSLVSPTSTRLSAEEARGVESDLADIWSLYRVWNELYLMSVRGHAADWIRAYVEHRLSPKKIRGHRLVANTRLEPRMCRVDYVALGESRKIAEIQWKSGGLGLFFGIRDVCADVFSCSADVEPLGNLSDNLFRVVRASGGADGAVAVNGVRNHWFKSEHYLKNLAPSLNSSWLPVIRDELPLRIVERSGRYFVSEGAHLHPVSFLYGVEFGNPFREGFERLARATVEGRIWVETPLNFMYRQKWGLALPFMAEFKSLFPPNLREIIIPTVLLNNRKLDLTPIVERMSDSERDRFSPVKTLDDIPDLPGSLRKSLVFKCGAGRGGFHSHGKGVFRMGGSRTSAQKVVDFVKFRMESENEPWIVQQYVQRTYAVSMCLPDAPNTMRTVDAHARFMVFGMRLGSAPPVVMGGLGNYGAHWKVSGRSPGLDEGGRLHGTAFNDMRVRRNC